MTNQQRTATLVAASTLGVTGLVLMVQTLGGWPAFAIFLLLWGNNLSQQINLRKPSCSCRGQ